MSKCNCFRKKKLFTLKKNLNGKCWFTEMQCFWSIKIFLFLSKSFMGNIGLSFGVWTQTPTHSQPENFLLQVPWVCASKHCSVSPEAWPLLQSCILIWSLSPKGLYHRSRSLQKQVTRIHIGFCTLDLSKMNMFFQLRIKGMLGWRVRYSFSQFLWS